MYKVPVLRGIHFFKRSKGQYYLAPPCIVVL